MCKSFQPGDLIIFNPGGQLISGPLAGMSYFGSFGMIVSTLRAANGVTVYVDGIVSFVDESLVEKADSYDYNLLVNAWYNKVK